MNKEELESELLKTLSGNSLNKVNDKVYLTNYQIDMLNKYKIPYKNANSITEILFYLNEIDDEDADEEFETLARELQERAYYNETHK